MRGTARLQAGYWALLAVTILVGQILNYIANGPAAQWIFFTNQSNVFLGFCAALTAVALWRDRAVLPPVLMGAAAVFISITALVYNVVLAGGPPRAGVGPPPHPGLATAINHLDHIVTPIAGVVGWLLLVAHGGLRWRHALTWLSYPAVYLVFVLLRASVVTGPYQYPYGFIDAGKHGYSGVAVNAVIYGFAFWIIGVAFVAVDRLIAARAPAALEPPAIVQKR